MYKKIYFLLITLLISNFYCFSQSTWTSISENRIKEDLILSRPNLPDNYKLVKLNLANLKKQVENAPKRNFINDYSDVIIDIPLPDGKINQFKIYEQSDFEEGLSKKYPEFKSYIGEDTKDKGNKIYFTLNANGFNGIILSPNNSSIYIDNYTKDLQNCIVYYRADLENTKSFSCHTQDIFEPFDFSPLEKRSNLDLQRNSNKLFRQYRMAMACTIEYARFHIDRAGVANGTDEQKIQVVLSAIQTTMNRVNSLYERDMAIRMNLVANNDQIIFIDSDEFSNNSANALINESQVVIDRIIGNTNYDIGHTVSTGGGGLAQLNSPCTTNKARGITGSSSPINDPFDIDYVAHEVGHQFGAQHTFNNSCDLNRSSSSSYEPGSGSTIMAYAGICAPNVARNSDDHFHNHSISQMSAFVQSGGRCSSNTSISNNPPTLETLSNYTIPFGTPFRLTATATDTEADQLTYVWEQMDKEITTQPPINTATTGPNYKSVRPSTSPTRYFPEFQNVLNGNLIPTWEVTPSVARTMNFKVTVRDNNTSGAQTSLGENIITVANTGPFRITSPATENVSWERGSQQTITWDVAGTTANGINSQNVNILISYDGGTTFTSLIENTPNDGTQTITVPYISSTNARILIEPTNNVFYAVSKRISIGYQVSIEDVCIEKIANYNSFTISNNNTYYSSVFNYTDDFVVNDIKVTANVTAERSSDFRLYLKNNGESGTYTNTIIGNNTCSITSIQNINASFENSSQNNINCSNINSGNTLKPFNNFVSNGVNANGQWTIYSLKTSTRNVALNQLKLTLCGTKTTYTLSTEDKEITNFKLFPNPNKGEFTLTLDSKSAKVNVEIFDIRGRLIYNKDYNSSGSFNQQINLNNVSKGIYLVKVKDGVNIRTEKIIIE